MTVGNLAALRQQNVKRMLAYSAIAHAGYLLAAFAGVSNQNGISESGIAAAAFYIAAYAAMNVGIFAVVTLVAGYEEQLSLIDDYRGLVYRSPILGSLLIFFLISLIGVPFTGGFFGKFYSFSAAVGGGAVWLAIIGLLNSGLAAAYYLRLVVVAAQKPEPDKATPPRPEIGIAVRAAIAMAVIATLALGIVPGAILDAAQSAGHTLQAPPQTAVPAAADPASPAP
jgi:NADH-quinone oxidoreductase subunit N